MNDDAKKKILARRSAFIAAALAGVAGATSCASPQPCLEPPLSPGGDGGANVDLQDKPKDPPPQPCLAPPVPNNYPDPPLLDAGPPPADAAGWPEPPPMVCLSIKYVPPDAGAKPKPPSPSPHPCLTPRRP